MKLLQAVTVTLAAGVSSALNIIVNNDDSWAVSNIRATYNALKAAGHNTFLIAPSSQMSGHGGTFVLPSNSTLLYPAEFNTVPVGGPAWGHDPNDDHIWYFNGTPSAVTSFGLDYVIPKFFNNIIIDLLVAGPNEGLNLGPGLFTISGTIGATYGAVARGVPGVAFSAAITNHSFYQTDLTDDPKFYSNIYASKVVELVKGLQAAAGDNPRLLPLGVGLNVNFPVVGNTSTTGCYDPAYVYSRITGGQALVPFASWDEKTGLFDFGEVVTDAANNCLNGNCALPGETGLLSQNCISAVSAFSIDYTANADIDSAVQVLLQNVVQN